MTSSLNATVEVLLTPEQIAAVPDWEEQFALFQSQWDVLARNIREKSRQCLHEGSHAMYNRRYGRDVRFYKPRAEYNGELKFTFGSVSPIINDDNWLLTDWENATISMAGFTVVERLTGLPEVEEVIKNDLRILTRKLEHSPRLPCVPEDFSERLKHAKSLGEFTILSDMEQPEFLRDLEQAARGYEREIFQTDEVWNWAARQYRFDLPGERYAAGRNGLDWLLIDDGNLKLIVDGVEVSADKRYELFFVAGGANASKQANDAVRRWNELVYTA